MSFSIDDHFKVGLDLVIEVDIRPRTSSGVIVSIASQAGEYLILQLVNGHVCTAQSILHKSSFSDDMVHVMYVYLQTTV